MPATFVDTVAWIALLNARDSLHNEARNIWSNLRKAGAPLITSEFVLVEFGNALSSVESRQRCSRLIQGLRVSSLIEIIPSSADLFDRGLALYSERPDKAWSLVDCTSFVIMTELRVTDAFTQDRHFVQAGFTKLF